MTKFVTVFNTHPWTEIDDSILEIQRKLETLKTKESTRKKLYKIFDNIHEKDISDSITGLESQLDSAIDLLKKKVKGTNTDANESKLKRGIQQQEQITAITKLLSELNKKIANDIKPQTIQKFSRL